MTPSVAKERRILPTLHKRHSALASGREQVAILDRVPLRASFEDALRLDGQSPLRSASVETLQINVGRRCNQTCRHCHVDAGPDRVEMMPDDVMDACLEVIEAAGIGVVDVTGGAPELHPRWRELVVRSRAAGARVIDRCNLTITLLPNYAYLPEFMARNGVEIVASLPHYRERQTDAQRGSGVFAESIEALRRLNALGYGKEGGGLVLNLMTNPVGTYLPGNQAALEREWKVQMERLHGITFNRLYVMTNMPISRFLEFLETQGRTADYLQGLARAHNPSTTAQVMCRSMVSVGWDGTLYDCDFNQMLEVPVAGGVPRTIFDFSRDLLEGREIVTGPHCFGCTAGGGSSCGGATVAERAGGG